jgi:hypothetical protein
MLYFAAVVTFCGGDQLELSTICKKNLTVDSSPIPDITESDYVFSLAIYFFKWDMI